MKTYEQYLKIIKDREFKEKEAERKRYEKLQADNPGTVYLGWDGTSSKMTFDYSVEIMGMMMQDFLKEFKENDIISYVQFDSDGRIRVTNR